MFLSPKKMLSICFLKDKLEKLNAQKVGTRSTRTGCKAAV
jgi:hypothetical protein